MGAVGAVDATTGETLEPKLLCSLPHIPVAYKKLYYGWLHQVGWVATWIAVTFPWLLQMFLAVGGFFLPSTSYFDLGFWGVYCSRVSTCCGIFCCPLVAN